MWYCTYNRKLLGLVERERNNNCLWYQIDGIYRESETFKKLCFRFIDHICRLNPVDKVGTIVHEFLKIIFVASDFRRGVYKDIRYKILPVLNKNHRAIERKKQKKLTFLVKELNRVGRYVEAHVIRVIVKPCIRDLNLKWRRMTALDKLLTVQ